MTRKNSFLPALAIAALAFGLAPSEAQAVTDGDLDGDDHPHVALMVAFIDGGPAWRCSGTFLSPTVYLTAGHCTEGADHVEIWLDSDVEAGIPDNGYPFVGDASGTPRLHPDYLNYAFFYRDVGVVVLDEPVILPSYGTLPRRNQLDRLAHRRGLQDVSFTAVGYGLQQVNPVFIEQEKVRMVATPDLLQINVPGVTGDFSLLLSNNHSTGGTCFGDSGGPNFVGDSNVVGGVTSFGMNGNCAGTGGVFRMDRDWALDWVRSFLD